MPRFVLLHHELPDSHARASHFDLMLEADGVLKTWALAELPAREGEVAAEQLADHRFAYLDYEGPVSGDRGRVSRSDFGSYQATFASDAVIGELQGQQLRGKFELVRRSEREWALRWSPVPSEPEA
jgi:hypothetical protein